MNEAIKRFKRQKCTRGFKRFDWFRFSDKWYYSGRGDGVGKDFLVSQNFNGLVLATCSRCLLFSVSFPL